MELNDSAKEKIRDELKKKEQARAREERKKIKITDFESLALIGRGAFGEVRLVRKIDRLVCLLPWIVLSFALSIPPSSYTHSTTNQWEHLCSQDNDQRGHGPQEPSSPREG